MRLRGLALLLFFVAATNCASAQESSGGNQIPKPEEAAASDYGKYLVNIDAYTSSGSVYHRKHQALLLTAVRDLVDKKGLDLLPGSVGFYFDRRMNVREQLFLGYDFTGDPELAKTASSYADAVRAMLSRYFPDLLSQYQLLAPILKETSVNGIVIGVKWAQAGRVESMNLWVLKDDLERYVSKELTFKELVIRATLTDSSGRIVRITF